jgi:hypothetical protein
MHFALRPGIWLLFAMLTAFGTAGSARAEVVKCTGALPQQAIRLGGGKEVGQQPDLLVSTTCTANVAGTYNYGQVNIVAGGTLEFDEPATAGTHIDFWASSILIQNGGSLVAGKGTPFGRDGGVLTIHLYGAPGDPGILCLDKTGKEDDTCGVQSAIWTENQMDQLDPGSCIHDATLPGGVKDCFYQYDIFDDADKKAGRKAYFGHKVLALSEGGSLQLLGKKGATYTALGPRQSGTSWGRVASGSLAVDAHSLQVDRALDWQVGDHFAVTTTDYLPGHSEELVITKISSGSGSTTIEFDRAIPWTDSGGKTHTGLEWPHNGKVFSFPASMPDRLGITRKSAETRAAVALLTRSISIVSEGDTIDESFKAASNRTLCPDKKTKGCYYFGGHTVARQGFAKFQVQGVEFRQLGQGGSIGHYPVHFHLARRTPPSTYLDDSSVDVSMTRWVVLHGTQGVTLARNVGYESIGHGFYLEDGTETDNKLYSNIGIFARAAVDNIQNPRQVPGLLTTSQVVGNPAVLDDPPYYSDANHPTDFWIMNGWNDFQGNMAAGAGACGMAYWLMDAAISGPSRRQHWFGYAGEQDNLDRAGIAPLKSFVGNYATAAMNAFTVNTTTAPCLGVSYAGTTPETPFLQMLASRTTPKSDDTFWPRLSGGGHFPTRCPDAEGANADFSECTQAEGIKKCSAEEKGHCDVVTLDQFTTSFSFPETNLAAVWLRPLWSLVVDSTITDSLSGGLNFVTGGGYSNSDVIPGYWGLARRTAFIGSTQPDNPLASEAGPFNPLTGSKVPFVGVKGLKCAKQSNGANIGNFCLSEDEGISMQIGNWGIAQRLYSVYDGPSYQDSNAYLSIQPTFLTGCKASDTDSNPCAFTGYMNGIVRGVRAPPPTETDRTCYLPNAAIGWKQPNGFYYAPAFHSTNLFFDNVTIRHYVIEPLFDPGTFTTALGKMKDDYCTWSSDGFSGFTDIDRETVLNDDDGSLTGLTAELKSQPLVEGETLSVNREDFFNAPTEKPECASDVPFNPTKDARLPPATAKTSPYRYLTTVVYPKCGTTTPDTSNPLAHCPDGNWYQDCTATNGTAPCYGVPLYRQFLTKAEAGNPNLSPLEQSKRMMGQSDYQRSSLSVNHGSYYIDTTVSKQKQQGAGATAVNVFTKGQTYYLFFLYANADTTQKYTLYVGKNFDTSTLQYGHVSIKTGKLNGKDSFTADLAGKGVFAPSYDGNLLTITTNMSKIADEFATTSYGASRCQPSSVCSWNGNACVTSLKKGDYLYDEFSDGGKNPAAICSWSVKDLDCPDKGCPAVALTMVNDPTAVTKDPRPAPVPFADDKSYDWAKPPFRFVDEGIAGKQCHYP